MRSTGLGISASCVSKFGKKLGYRYVFCKGSDEKKQTTKVTPPYGFSFETKSILLGLHTFQRIYSRGAAHFSAFTDIMLFSPALQPNPPVPDIGQKC